MPWTSLAWFVNLFYFLYISDKTESRSLNIKLSFMFGSIKSPVQHSISSSQSFNIYCTPSVLSRADALDCSAKTHTNFSEHLQAPALLYMPLSTLMSNNLMSRCFMCYHMLYVLIFWRMSKMTSHFVIYVHCSNKMDITTI